MHSIKISGKTLRFHYIEVNKKIYTSKQPIALSLVIVDQILLLTNLSIVIIVSNILLATKKIILLDHYVLFRLKSENT